MLQRKLYRQRILMDYLQIMRHSGEIKHETRDWRFWNKLTPIYLNYLSTYSNGQKESCRESVYKCERSIRAFCGLLRDAQTEGCFGSVV